jgi:hypothetical protein
MTNSATFSLKSWRFYKGIEKPGERVLCLDFPVSKARECSGSHADIGLFTADPNAGGETSGSISTS